MYGNFWPIRAADLQHRFVILLGDVGFGKTMLGAWMLDLSLRLGHRVRYVKVASEVGGVDYIKILQLIWGVNKPGLSSPLTDPLPVVNPDLEALLASSKDTSVYAVFRQALAETSKERPVTIVLDEFKNSMDTGSFWTLWENLFVPLAAPEFQHVHLVLALGDDEYSGYRIDDVLKARPELRIPRKDIRLERLDEKEFIERFLEYLYFRSKSFRDEEIRGTIIGMVKASVKNDKNPLTVARLEEKTIKVAGALELELEALK
jgi:hypothetical protein